MRPETIKHVLLPLNYTETFFYIGTYYALVTKVQTENKQVYIHFWFQFQSFFNNDWIGFQFYRGIYCLSPFIYMLFANKI